MGKKKHHLLGSLKQQKYILSSLWSLEAEHLGVGSAVSGGPREIILSHLFCLEGCWQFLASLTDSCITPVSASVFWEHLLWVCLPCPRLPVFIRPPSHQIKTHRNPSKTTYAKTLFTRKVMYQGSGMDRNLGGILFNPIQLNDIPSYGNDSFNQS